MKKTKLIILTMLALVLVNISCIAYGASTIKNDMQNIGNDIKSETQKVGTDIKDTTNSFKNDITSQVNTNRINTNNTTNTGTYTTSRVGYTDSVNMFGIPMSRTSVVLLVVALAAIIVSILIFSYVVQENDRYRDEDNY